MPLQPNFTCPFCCERFTSREILFRCDSSRCWERREDEHYSRFTGHSDIVLGRILVPTSNSSIDHTTGLPRAVSCDICNTSSQTQICPSCHSVLPEGFSQAKQLLITLMGGSAVGKTHFLVALLHRLQIISSDLQMSVKLLGNITSLRWKNDYEPLFGKKELLEPTPGVEMHPPKKYPLVLRLIANVDGIKQICDVGFCDVSSVDMQQPESKTMAWYTQHTDGIIFLLDPLLIPGALPESIQYRKQFARDTFLLPENTVVYLRQLYEASQRLQSIEKIPLPIAFTLSKFDLLFPYLEPGSQLKRYALPSKTVDLEHLQSISTEITALLSSWFGPAFCQGIRRDISQHAFFGASSLGDAPLPHQTLSCISPLRVEDPFLWLLCQTNVLKLSKKER